MVIPDMSWAGIRLVGKPCAGGDRLAAYQLVGGVVAYQGFDG